MNPAFSQYLFLSWFGFSPCSAFLGYNWLIIMCKFKLYVCVYLGHLCVAKWLPPECWLSTPHHVSTDNPWSMMTSDVLSLQWCEKDMRSGKSMLQIFNMLRTLIIKCWPSGVNNWYTHSHSVPRQPVCFSLSLQYSIHYMRYSTFNFKLSFALDDIAPLWTGANVPSILKASWCSVG